ncbi:MAG: beta strand repeat-containing protein [Caulobacteraceae bacterium]
MPTPTIRWTAADGDWATSTDWSLGRLPGAGDRVVIDTNNFHTVTHGSGDDTVKTLRVGNDDFVISGGSLAIAGAASFANGLTLSGGTLTLGGDATAANFTQNAALAGRGTLTVAGQADLNGLQTGRGRTILQGASSANFLALDGRRVLENQGTLTLAGNGEIDFGSNPFGQTLGGGFLINDAGATIDLTGDNHLGFVEQLPQGSVGIVNAGTFEKTVAAGPAQVTVDFANTGTVRVESGRLEIDAAFVDSGPGTAEIASGATLSLGGGGSANPDAFVVAAGGRLEFSDSPFAPGSGVFALGAGTLRGTTELSGGELALGANDVKANRFSQEGGTVSGTGTFTLAGATFTDGRQTGAGVTVLRGATTVDGVLTVDGGRLLENKGVLTVAGFFRGIELGDSQTHGTLLNDAGATINLTGGCHIWNGLGSSFINAGTLVATTNVSGAPFVSVDFTNTGQILVQSGGLGFIRPFTNSAGGTISVASGASIDFRDGTANASDFTVAAGGYLLFEFGRFSLGAGTVGGGGTVEVIRGQLALGSNAVTVTGFRQESGQVSGSGTFTVTGAAGFSGARVVQVGSGATVLQGASSIEKGLWLDGDRVLENQGALTLTVSAEIRLGARPSGPGQGGGVLRNAVGGTLDLQGTNQILAFAGATSFTNAGTLEKTAGTGVAVVGVAVTDTGQILARAGTLDFTQAIGGDGAMAVDAGAALEVDASAAASLSMTFNGGGGILALGDPSAFAATIAGFTGGDTIDLLGTAATRAVLKSGDRLVIFNGADEVATLQLTGDYAGNRFHVSSDGAGGSNIAVTASGSAAQASRGSHRFVAAMAGLGTGGGGPVHATAGARLDSLRPTLCAPGAG